MPRTRTNRAAIATMAPWWILSASTSRTCMRTVVRGPAGCCARRGPCAGDVRPAPACQQCQRSRARRPGADAAAHWDAVAEQLKDMFPAPGTDWVQEDIADDASLTA